MSGQDLDLLDSNKVTVLHSTANCHLARKADKAKGTFLKCGKPFDLAKIIFFVEEEEEW